MQRKDIFYNNLVTLLKVISQDPYTEKFYNEIGDLEKQKRFAELVIDDLSKVISDINQSITKNVMYGNYSGLTTILKAISDEFPLFKIDRIKEIQLIILIQEAISNQITDFDVPVNVDTTTFELLNVDSVFSEVELKCYCYHNSVVFLESLLLFSFCELEAFSQALDAKPSHNIDLLFILLSKLGNQGLILTGDYHVLVKLGSNGKLNRVKSALLLQAVSDGKHIHRPLSYNHNPNNLWRDLIKIENKYQQFIDTIHILSEYNYADDIISKYLKLYQIIEDFMYKSSLVRMERENSGRLFSIRDFKRMNENISKKEYESLELLIKAIFSVQYSAGDTFGSHILSIFKGLPPNISIIQIDAMFDKLDIEGVDRFSAVNRSNIKSVYAKLIYFFRNSIVHNKTTEFHLTYNTITSEIAKFMELFLIPTIESIVFYLATDVNAELVRFSNEHLNIWTDN